MKNKKQNEIGIGKRIKQARMKTNLSSIKVSQELGLSASMCSQWERGNANPSTAHLAKLAKILSVSIEWLALGEAREQETQDDFMRVFKKLSPTQQKYLTQFLDSLVQVTH